MIELTQPGSGKVFRVAESSAGFWRSLGYRDAPPTPVEEPEPVRKRPAKKAARKPSDD